ncbi:hypothetical protein KsCSTR_36360 [Candidatus Kuenenia stuttgartiensis]|uniref:Uncharacterized protein n=1 Tax=Kuenenia stuttgartiensis TaxID=174633 RepID=A0A6G7GU25_KUEST|nr:hypothetical protein KsCSTR_36360 [Candidatus Kuenenia stuttgartiensis]
MDKMPIVNILRVGLSGLCFLQEIQGHFPYFPTISSKKYGICP